MNLNLGGIWALDEISCLTENENVQNVCSIMPVNTQTPRAGSMAFNMSGFPVLQALLRNMTQPVFDGTPENWPKFWWEFQKFVQLLSQTMPLNDTMKLMLFTNCMPESVKNEIDFEARKSNGMVSFMELLAKFEQRFGTGKDFIMRRKWQDVTLVNNGKISTNDWMDFKVKFNSCALDVKDADPNECYRMLMQKLPSFILTMIVEKEEKNSQDRPILNVVCDEKLNCEQMMDIIEGWVGERPKKVEKERNGSFQVYFSGMTIAEKLMSLHGRTVMGGQKDCKSKLLNKR